MYILEHINYIGRYHLYIHGEFEIKYYIASAHKEFTAKQKYIVFCNILLGASSYISPTGFGQAEFPILSRLDLKNLVLRFHPHLEGFCTNFSTF